MKDKNNKNKLLKNFNFFPNCILLPKTTMELVLKPVILNLLYICLKINLEAIYMI